MKKKQFLSALQKKLSGLPKLEVEESLNFYSEMIDDRMEEGYVEDDAVSAVGSVDEISAQIIADTPLVKIAKERVKPNRRLKTWEIVLLILGSPIWLSLLIAGVAVIFSIYAVALSLIVSLWAIFVALGACAIAGVVAGISFVIRGYGVAGVAVISVSVLCAGLAIFLFFVRKGGHYAAINCKT